MKLALLALTQLFQVVVTRSRRNQFKPRKSLLVPKRPKKSYSRPSVGKVSKFDQNRAQEIYKGFWKLRKGKKIPISKRLERLARMHLDDLDEHGSTIISNECDEHSWGGPKVRCCYKSDHSNFRCIWNKGKLVGIKEDVAEIYFASSSRNFKGKDAVKGWDNSQAHRIAIVNGGPLKNVKWAGVGVATSGKRASAWFAISPENSRSLSLNHTLSSLYTQEL